MVVPRALVTVLIALIKYIITTYVELQGAFIVYLQVNNSTAFSHNLVSDRFFFFWGGGEKLEERRARRWYVDCEQSLLFPLPPYK